MHIPEKRNIELAVDISELRFSWSAGLNPILEIERLQIKQGERVFIVGPSGSGKSTLLSLIAGIVTPQHGTIKVTGNPNTVKSMPENIDLDLSSIITQNESIDQAGERIWDLVVKVANGKLTCAEVLGECQLSVSRWGLSV